MQTFVLLVKQVFKISYLYNLYVIKEDREQSFEKTVTEIRHPSVSILKINQVYLTNQTSFNLFSDKLKPRANEEPLDLTIPLQC